MIKPSAIWTDICFRAMQRQLILTLNGAKKMTPVFLLGFMSTAMGAGKWLRWIQTLTSPIRYIDLCSVFNFMWLCISNFFFVLVLPHFNLIVTGVKSFYQMTLIRSHRPSSSRHEPTTSSNYSARTSPKRRPRGKRAWWERCLILNQSTLCSGFSLLMCSALLF